MRARMGVSKRVCRWAAPEGFHEGVRSVMETRLKVSVQFGTGLAELHLFPTPLFSLRNLLLSCFRSFVLELYTPVATLRYAHELRAVRLELCT